MSQQFCLKWNSHMTNMMDVFKSLLSTESMVDCTLACDGLSLKAHKIVLSACSPFFQALFLENPCKHPIVILKDMKYTELKAIIEFMYHGEVNVGQDQLSALMKTAETLRVKGLAEVTNEKNSQSNASGDEPSHRSVPRTETPPPSKRRRRTRKRSLSDSNRSDDESNEPKVKQPMSPDIEELSGDHTMEATSGHFSSIQSQVPMQQMPSHSTNSFQRTNVAQDSPHVEEPTSADESEFGVEPAKLLEQTLTTDDLANARRGRSSAQSGMERRSRSTDHSSSLVPTSMPSDSYSSSMNQQLESPPDIKPELLDLDPPISPVPGPSHSADNSMMYDQSSVSSHPGTSFQDNSGALVPQDSSPQGSTNVNLFKCAKRGTVYSCQSCSYTAVQRQSMKVHLMRHAGIKPHKCRECGKSFTLSSHLKRHLPTHKKRSNLLTNENVDVFTSEDKGITKYSCKSCSYKTYVKQSMIFHLMRHAGMMPYKCCECGKGFVTTSHLKRHQLTHEKRSERLKNASPYFCSFRDESGSLMFVCKFCNYQTKWKTNMMVHVTAVHVEIKSHKCPKCERTFVTSSDLKNHLGTHGKLLDT